MSIIRNEQPDQSINATRILPKNFEGMLGIQCRDQHIEDLTSNNIAMLLNEPISLTVQAEG